MTDGLEADMAALRADFAAALCKDNSYFCIRSPNRTTRPTYPFNNHVEVYGDAKRRGHLKTLSCFREIPHRTVKFRRLVAQDDLSGFEYAFA
jgi:hypothetical protein